MTYANFKDMLSSYNNRLAALFVTVGSQDIVLIAMNDARRDAMRRYKFNMTQRQAFVDLSLAPASMLSAFKDLPSGSNTVVVSRLDMLWEYNSASVSSTTRYYPTKALDIRSMTSMKNAIPVQLVRAGNAVGITQQDFAYIQGTDVRHSNLTAPTNYMASVCEFLPDFASGDSPDIFLTYHTDWLKWATLLNLNMWLKDNERFQIDATVLQKSWESVTQFDSAQSIGGPISLD